VIEHPLFKEQKMQTRLTGAGLAAIALLLTGCGDMNLKKYNPFGGDAVQERSRTPTNATEYQCAGGKRLYIRMLDGGEAVWLILAERELRLERIGSSQRYSKGNTILSLNGNEAGFADGTATPPYSGCKTGGSEPAAPAPAST
jgi:membrane-bound inhibitor of C-type lysozyme